MTTLHEDYLKELTAKISAMELDQLYTYGVSVSMAYLDPSSSRVLHEAIDARTIFLTCEDASGLVINGEVSAEETRDD